MTRRRVAITGLGALTPIGNNVRDSWAAARAGKSGGGRITRFDASEYASQIAAEVKGFDPAAYFETKEIKKVDIFAQFAVAAAQEAWEDSGLSTAVYDKSRMGCVLGIGIGGLTTIEKYHRALVEGGPRKISPFLIPAMISNIGPGHIAIRWGLKGVNYTVTSACASATHAIGEAAHMIAHGIQDVVITGGAESGVTPMGIGGFCSLKALTTRNDSPEKASRPFDRDRDGFLLGEGAGVLVLEPLDLAEKRGAKIYGEVLGYGASCDAYHVTAPSENGEGAVLCMRNALADAGIQPGEVGYINAHGTSTDLNDPIETAAIKEVFGPWAKNGLLVSSTKSMTGHMLGAAGAVEAMFSMLALHEGVIPPTINLENPGEGCDLDYVANVAREVKVRIAMSNSFGFGGTNACVVLKALN